jgi:hypothetical protein
MIRNMYEPGEYIYSPGSTFCYEIIGPVCRLYDREELPYPCCSLAWKGKQPSWNRIGKRFVVDMATKAAPSYSVVLKGTTTPIILTLYYQKLNQDEKEWWVTPSCKLRHYDYSLPQISNFEMECAA